jgi:hypothetical protein
MAGVVTYLNINGGTPTTPPTQAQAALINSVIATVAPNTNTPANTAVTHNLNFPAADISAGYPSVGIEALDNLAGTSGWFLQSLDPNFVGLAQVNTSGGVDTNAQIKVRMDRNWTSKR